LRSHLIQRNENLPSTKHSSFIALIFGKHFLEILKIYYPPRAF